MRTKHLVVVLLVFQNSVHVLLTGYSKKILQETYISSTVILLSEIAKTSFSWFMLTRSNRDSPVPIDYAYIARSSLPLAVPAAVYFIQNWLSFLALRILSPTVYATLAQLKLLTTAVFHVSMMGRKLSANQWRALCVLTMGCILVQSRPCAEDADSTVAGVLCMLGYAVLSGFSGVYFEKVLKGSKMSLWARNVQLGSYSIFFSLLWTVSVDFSRVYSEGFFAHYSRVTWCIVTTSSCGGILVALVVKYGDNILKGFATSFAIVLTAFSSYLFLGTALSLNIAIGAANVIISSFIFNSEPKRKPEPKVVHFNNVDDGHRSSDGKVTHRV